MVTELKGERKLKNYLQFLQHTDTRTSEEMRTWRDTNAYISECYHTQTDSKISIKTHM